MWTKATIGALAAVVVVAGGAGAAIAHAQTTSAPAASASPTGTATSGSTATATATKAKANGKGAAKGQADSVAKEILGKVADFQHAEWVTKGDSNTYVTHEAIQGQITAVSASSITVKSADGTTMTFAVNANTTVREAKAKAAKGTKGAPGTATTAPSSPTSSPTTSAATPSVTDLKTGQTVIVGGMKSPDLTAQRILARAA